MKSSSMKSFQQCSSLARKDKQQTAAYIRAQLETNLELLTDFLTFLLPSLKPIDDAESISWLRWLMAGGLTPEQFAAEVKRYDNATTCGLVWTANFVAYRCRTCGISPCMSLCADCFQRGNHENHDFNMFRSQAGGACDCGDVSVMKESGFCGRHGPQAQQQKPPAPEELLLMPHAMLPRLMFRLMQHLRTYPGTTGNLIDEADNYLTMLQEFSSLGAAVRSVMTQAITDTQVYKNLDEWFEPEPNHTLQIYESAVKSLSNPLPPDEYRDCPSLQEPLVHKTFLEELMFWTVKLEFPQKVVCLLLNMLPDPDYKEALTRSFVLHYSRIPTMLEASTSPDTLSNRVVHVSVQLFSNESLALKMTTQMSLLHVMVVSLKYMMSKILIPHTLHDGRKNFHMVVDCGQQVMKEHCYWPLVSDLNNVLSHRPVALRFMNDNNLLEMWFTFLSMFQGMNVNQRELCQHVEFEPSTYYAAFSAELEASAYPMWALVSHLRDASTVHLTRAVLKACVSALQEWFEAINFTGPSKNDCKQVSFHLPLHRYLAILMSQAVKCQGVSLKEVLPPPEVLNLVYQHPLRLQAAFYEILNGMWVRNGLQIKGQMMTYIQCNFCNSMVDADLYLLQVCATQIDSEKFLLNVLKMFRVVDALSVSFPKVPLAFFGFHDHEFESAMLESCLTFLATLVDIRSNLGADESWLSKLEMVTLLCMSDKTHSQLMELMPERCGTGQSRDLDQMLADVADYRAPSNMQQGMYAPKPYVWEQLYDPVHVLLRAVHRRDFQTSMDRFSEYVQQTRKLKPGSGTVWPPFRPPFSCGDPYEDPRKILQSRVIHAMIFCLLYQAVGCGVERPANISEHVLALVIYLLEMAVMSCPIAGKNADVSSASSAAQICTNSRNPPVRYDVRDRDLPSFYESDWLPCNLRTVIHNAIHRSVFVPLDREQSDSEDFLTGITDDDLMDQPFLDVVPFEGDIELSSSRTPSTPTSPSSPTLPSTPTTPSSSVARRPSAPLALPSTSTQSPSPGSPFIPIPGSAMATSNSTPTNYQVVPISQSRRPISSLRSLAMRNQVYTAQLPSTSTQPWPVVLRMDVPQSSPAIEHFNISPQEHRDVGKSATSSSNMGNVSKLKDVNEDLPIGESIISLLLRLHSNLSGTPDSYQLNQHTNEGLFDSRIGDGPFFVAKVLDRIAALDDSCRDCIIQTKAQLWPQLSETDKGGTEAKAKEEKEKEERRRRAKERQQRLIEEFASKQKQFMEKAKESEDAEEMDWSEEQERAKVKCEYDCVICNQTTPSTEECPMGLVVLLQATSVLGHMKLTPNVTRLPTAEEELPQLANMQTLAKDFEKKLAILKEDYDAISWQMSVNIGWQGGVNVQTCGHHVHLSCLKSYLLSLKSQQRQPSLAVDRGEYSCPICRQLANSVLPLSPELGDGTTPLLAPPTTIAVPRARSAQIAAIAAMLAQPPVPPAATPLLDAIRRSMEDMTNATPARFRSQAAASASDGTASPSPQVLTMYVASMARTNLELEMVHKGGRFMVGSVASPLTPKRSCIVPLLHVLAMHTRFLIHWSEFNPWRDLTEVPGSSADSTQVANICREMPLLLRDPTALLIHITLLLPLHIDQSYFCCVVQCFFNLLYFQVLLQICLNMTENQRASWRDPKASTCDVITGLDTAMGFVISQIEGTGLEIEESGEARECFVTDNNSVLNNSSNNSDDLSNCDDLSNRQDVERRVRNLCLPFLRIAALLRHHLYSEEIPVSFQQTEFVRLVYYLELVTEGMNWSRFNASVALNLPGAGLALPRNWFRHLAHTAMRSRNCRQVARTLHRNYHPPRLLELPQLYDRIFQFYHARQCNTCSSVPRETSICLLCGQLVCLKENCCKTGPMCEAVQHAMDCGAGTGMFLVVTSSYVIVIRGKRACLWGSVYLDSFGEEDRELKRGKPLFLCYERYRLLQEQWLAHRFDHTNKKWVWHRDAL